MRFRPLLAAAALFSMAPATSFAAIDCARICDGRNCAQYCQDGLIPTTCGGAGYCDMQRHEAAPSLASTEQESRQAEATGPVCSEAHPSPEQSATAES